MSNKSKGFSFIVAGSMIPATHSILSQTFNWTDPNQGILCTFLCFMIISISTGIITLITES